MYLPEDTIAAPATIPGTGAISVIRVSGPRALEATDAVVRFRRGTAVSAKGYSLKYGEVPDVDEVLVSVFRAPASYTGEDSTEISCHASAFVVSKILELLAAAGCRMAQPGEFTRRAFVNGKMDLAQAEAVADLIAAGSEAAHRIALKQLRGGFSAKLMKLRDSLVELSALMELELDFSEEDVEFADRTKLRGILGETLAEVDSLAASFRAGNAIKNGVPVAIVGPVNAGKSTLLNALCGEARAIVSDIAGTTRDTVEETLTLGGILFRFIDTAGLRDTSDEIEKIGIERSRAAIAKADVVIALSESTSPAGEREAFFREISGLLPEGTAMIRVISKADLVEGADDGIGGDAGKGANEGSGECTLRICAKDGSGLEELRSAILATQEGRYSAEELLVTNLRHFEALRSASGYLRSVRSGLDSALPTDLVAEDLRAAISELNSIFGDRESVDFQRVTDVIFSRFCIGK